MRYLALLLLLTCGYSQAAAVICPDGLTWVDNNTALCPVNSTNLSVLNITQTTATFNGTADAQATGSTLYYWISSSQFPAGCTSLNYSYAHLTDPVTSTRQAAEKARQKCMNYKTMIAGTGSVTNGYGSGSIAPGTFSIGITGPLTAASTYYVQHFVAGGVGGAGKIGRG